MSSILPQSDTSWGGGWQLDPSDHDRSGIRTPDIVLTCVFWSIALQKISWECMYNFAYVLAVTVEMDETWETLWWNRQSPQLLRRLGGQSASSPSLHPEIVQKIISTDSCRVFRVVDPTRKTNIDCWYTSLCLALIGETQDALIDKQKMRGERHCGQSMRIDCLVITGKWVHICMYTHNIEFNRPNVVILGSHTIPVEHFDQQRRLNRQTDTTRSFIMFTDDSILSFYKATSLVKWTIP